MPDINIGQIGINPGNFGGLAQLAGTRTGNLNLPVPDYSAIVAGGQGIAKGVEGLQQALQARRELAAQQQNSAADRAQQQQQFNANLGLQQQQEQRLQSTSDQENAYRQTLLEQQQKEFDLRASKTALDLTKQEKADKIQASAVGLFNLSQISEDSWNDPKKRAAAIGAQVKSGTLSPEDGKNLTGMAWADMRTTAKSMFVIANKASQFNALDAQNQKTTSVGSNVTVLPDGTVQVNSKPTATTTTTAQKNMMDASTTLNQIGQSFDSYQKDYAAAGGKVKYGYLYTKAQAASLGVGAPLDPEESQWLQGYTTWASGTSMLALSFIKQLSGVQYSDKQLAFLKQILPSTNDTDEMIQGKKDMLMSYLNKVQASNAKILADGIQYSSDPNSEYAQKFLTSAQSAFSEVIKPKGKTATTDMVNWYATQHNLSVDEAKKQIEANGYTIEESK